MSVNPRRLLLAATALASGVCAASAVTVATAPLVGASVTAAKSTSYPVTIKAANGSVTIAARPTAIVSLSPTSTEMLYAIGAGHQVKAVDKYSDFPKGVPHTNLDEENPNVEAIVSYKPDLVVVNGDSTGLTAQLAKFGIPVLSQPAATNLAQEYAQFRQLGAATGRGAQAASEITSIRAQLARIVKATPKHGKPFTYYYELTTDYYSVTSSTFVGQLLGLLGLHSIADSAKGAAAAGGYPQLSAEFIIKSNPSYIFLADTVCCGQTAKTVGQRAGWSGLAAVKAGRVVGLNDDIASRWGPRVTDLLRTVANAIVKSHP